MEHAQTYAKFRIIIGIKAPWRFMAAGESVVVGVRVRCDGLKMLDQLGVCLDHQGFFIKVLNLICLDLQIPQKHEVSAVFCKAFQ